MPEQEPLLYTELASWWPLLSPPSHYVEEAADLLHPGDNTFEVVFAFMLREADGSVRVVGDRHVNGLFPRAAWLAWLEEAGFTPSSRFDPWERDVFLGKKLPKSGGA